MLREKKDTCVDDGNTSVELDVAYCPTSELHSCTVV